MNKYFLIAVTGLLLLSVSCKEKVKEIKLPEVHEISGGTMGTTYSVKVVKNDSTATEQKYAELKSEIDDVLVEVNRQMSHYQPYSEISTFNDYNDTNWFPISKDFACVVERALQIGLEADSSIDITLGSLVNLWGFGTQKRASQVPDSLEIKTMLNTIGNDKILVRTKPASIKKKFPNVTIDLSSIAKGFGVDKVYHFLEDKGFTDFMVEIGGEVRTKNKNASGKEWRIGVSTPDASMNLQKVVMISNKALATSGDYRNYFEVDGQRYSHTIDPRTGYPITHTLASVTVVTDDCMSADAYATAIDVMGPEKGLEFAKERKLPIFMIVRENNEFKEISNEEFNKYFADFNPKVEKE